MGKHESGFQKRKRNQKKEELIQSQRGAMDRFVKKKPEVPADNESADPSTLTLDVVPYNDPGDSQTGMLPHSREKREIKRKKQFDENPDNTNVATQSVVESFRVNYFIPLVDQAISSLITRFEQYKGYQEIFGFLFTSETLQSLDNDRLKSSCEKLEAALRKGKKSDIDANDLYVELKFIQDFIPKEKMGPIEVLNFFKAA
jgi:hypothetical protein